MKKSIVTILIVVGLALLVAAGSVWAFPGWIDAPGGMLALFGAAFLAVAGIGGSLDKWRGFLFPPEKKDAPPPASQPDTPLERTQTMTHSEEGEQTMRGKGGVQRQDMKDSPRGKQTME